MACFLFVFSIGCLAVPTQDMNLRHAAFFFAPTGWAMGNGAKRKRSLILEKAKSKPVNDLQAIAMCDLCSELEARARRHSHGYYHYTLWRSFAKMAKGQTTSDCEYGRKFVRLSSSKLMNDAFDRRMQDGTYLMSFSIGEEENVATWIIYGRDSEKCSCKNNEDLCKLKMNQAVRLMFRMKALNKWVREFNDGKHKVYVYDDKEEALKVQQNLNATARLLDVAYIGSKCDTSCPCIKLGKQEYKILDWSSTLSASPKYAPFFKFKGWEDERETRLVVEVKGITSFPDCIFLPFDGPIDTLIEEAVSNIKGKNSSGSITMGPWFNKKERYDKVEGLDVCKNTSASFYLDQIDLSTRKPGRKVGNV